MERFDIAIIGTGPAGLSAAITAKVRNKRILLFGNSYLSAKVEKAHMVQNYLGLPRITGEEMKKVFLEHLCMMDTCITEDKINAVYAMGEYFAVQGHKENYEALSVILATGVSVAKPYPGELDNLGRGVSYCTTCDAALYRGKTAIVVASSKEEEEDVRFLAKIAEKVYYVPLYEEVSSFESNVEVLLNIKPIGIEKNQDIMSLITNQEKLKAHGIFLLRDHVAPSQLVPGVQVTGNSIDVDRQMRTSISGLFACGDVTGTPYQYMKAAGEGNVAALSAVSYLAKSSMSND